MKMKRRLDWRVGLLFVTLVTLMTACGLGEGNGRGVEAWMPTVQVTMVTEQEGDTTNCKVEMGNTEYDRSIGLSGVVYDGIASSVVNLYKGVSYAYIPGRTAEGECPAIVWAQTVTADHITSYSECEVVPTGFEWIAEFKCKRVEQE